MFREGTANARYYWPMAVDREDLIGGEWDRAPRMKVPRWWLSELARLVDAWLENVGGARRTLEDLAEEVSKKAGRTEEWTHGTISKCRDGKLVAWDLVVALCDFFPGLPEPLYSAMLRLANGDGHFDA